MWTAHTTNPVALFYRNRYISFIASLLWEKKSQNRSLTGLKWDQIDREYNATTFRKPHTLHKEKGLPDKWILRVITTSLLRWPDLKSAWRRLIHNKTGSTSIILSEWEFVLVKYQPITYDLYSYGPWLAFDIFNTAQKKLIDSVLFSWGLMFD